MKPVELRFENVGNVLRCFDRVFFSVPYQAFSISFLAVSLVLI